MKLLITGIIILLFHGTTHGQKLSFSPEFVFGNRSFAYQHFVKSDLSEKWSMNNVTLFDTEHKGGDNNIFFIRNTLVYKLNKSYQLNAATGVKNPGAFGTVSAQYKFTKQAFYISYSIGATYQDDVTLEQSISINYSPQITSNTRLYINLFMVSNTDFSTLIRGIQQLRLGITKNKLMTGVAFNFDQFNNSSKTLSNYGIFIKFNY